VLALDVILTNTKKRCGFLDTFPDTSWRCGIPDTFPDAKLWYLVRRGLWPAYFCMHDLLRPLPILICMH